ncbi:MAG: FtsH protease activity modulator HflK [Spirochaetaceae bacterium]|nr:FtsH protease activity modulator HflK [Spirochaetaceae bacterium]
MGWIAAFVIIYLIATIVLSVIEGYFQSEIKRNDKEEVDSRYSRRTYRSGYGSYQQTEEEPKKEYKSQEQIRAEAKEQMRKIKWIAYGAITAVVFVITLFNCVFFTNEQEIAYTMTFGNATIVEGAGAHFKMPFITSKEVLDATNKGMAIGYDLETNESLSEDSLMITSDFNFVNTDFYVEYRISDPIAYVYGSSDPEGILRNIAQASIRNTVGLYDVDVVLTTGKSEIEAIVKELIIEKLQHHETGLSIVGVSIQDVEPPTEEVSAAFKDVETAKQNAESVVNEAKAAEQAKIPDAEAKADKIIKDAEAEKTERINQATQEVAEFMALYHEYMENPATVKLQLYYSMMEDILPGMEIIIGNDSKVIYVKNGEAVTNP